MTDLRVLSYILMVAGAGALVLLALNALGWKVMGGEPAPYVVPGSATVLVQPMPSG